MNKVYYSDDPAIYGLVGPDGRIFYVGKTKRSTRARMYEHRYRVPFHPGPVYEKWREFGLDGVSIMTLEAGDDLERETYWIEKLRSEGQPLVNELVGTTWSTASKKRVGRSNKGKTTWIKGLTGEAAGWTPERRAKQSERIRAYNEQRATLVAD